MSFKRYEYRLINNNAKFIYLTLLSYKIILLAISVKFQNFTEKNININAEFNFQIRNILLFR